MCLSIVLSDNGRVDSKVALEHERDAKSPRERETKRSKIWGRVVLE